MLLRLILTGHTYEIVPESENDNLPERASKHEAKSLYQKALSLFQCCVGLQVSYLVWGILQEKIMTR